MTAVLIAAAWLVVAALLGVVIGRIARAGEERRPVPALRLIPGGAPTSCPAAGEGEAPRRRAHMRAI